MQTAKNLETKKGKFLIKAGILASSSVQMSIMGIAVAIAPMIAYFTGAAPTTIMLLVTIPSLVCIPVQLVVGSSSHKTGKKIPLLIGLGIMGVCGIIPAFIQPSLSFLIAISVLIGIGNGFVIPTSTGLITDYFSGPEAGDLMGKQSAFINFGAMMLSTIGGLLCVSAWNKTYLIFIYPLLILIISMLCIPNDYQRARSIHAEQSTAPKAKLTKEVFIMSGIILLYGIFFGVLNTNNSVLVAERSIGNAAVAGIAGSVMTGIGILVGLTYGRLVGLFKKWVLPSALAVVCVGMLIMGLSVSPIMLYIGAGVCGFGFSLCMPTCLFRTAQAVEPSAATFAMTVFLSCVNVGMFLSPILLNPLSSSIANGSAQSRYFIGAVGIILLSVYARFHVSKDK